MYEFRIEIAGIPAVVRCSFAENQEFFHDYFSDKEPVITIEPNENDLQQMQRDFDRLDEDEGHPKHQRTDGFLENNAIHSLLAENLRGMTDKTVVIVTHRKAVLSICDRVLEFTESGVRDV